MTDQEPISFPSYDPPQPPTTPGIPVASRDQAKPMQKMISRMFKGPRKMGKVPRGVKNNHHQVKFY